MRGVQQVTNKKMDTIKALTKYLNKDMVEMAFDNIK